ncbi:DUF6221 family protein [Streptomyces sp. NPDC003300]|uniref:DUF6221 family protein n=1 Tax=unclassified Streptomyces TaxID=2593676 RepID=UPI0033A75D51
MTTDSLVWVRAEMDAAEAVAVAAREVDYAGCGIWEPRGPYPAESGEADGVSRPRGNLRAEIGRDDIFLDAELPWGLIPHMARHDPAAVLRRIAADRKIIQLHDQPHECSSTDWISREHDPCCWIPEGETCDTIRHLAEGYGWTAG